MKTIVGVRFRKPGKVYFFDPGYIQLNLKDKVVVETTMGEDVGEVVINKRQIPDDKVSTELKRIVRLALDNEKNAALRGIIFGALNDQSIAWKVAERAENQAEQLHDDLTVSLQRLLILLVNGNLRRLQGVDSLVVAAQ